MTQAKKNKLELQYQIVLRNYMKYEVWSNKIKATRVASYMPCKYNLSMFIGETLDQIKQWREN